ncbi:ATP-binding cassette domain-containing protein [bacterium]|nr:ATP-binding cassette domain-containing protein [bacterium]
MIQVNGLSKEFEDRKRGMIRAVDNITFEVKKGEIFGLLGTNGAGKTTTLRMLASIFKPTTGTANVAGFDVLKESEEVRRHIGFLSGDTKLYQRLTAKEVLKYYGGLYELDSKTVDDRIEELSNLFELHDFEHKKIAKLSTGQRQRVSIARSIIHKPQLMIFDEPTAGLDPISARHIKDFIRRSREEGRTILFSTHILHEAESLCDRIAIIHKGTIGVCGDLQHIFNETSTKNIEEAFFKVVENLEDESLVRPLG